MNFIKIDSQTRSITLVQSTGKNESLRQLIDCDSIDMCARQGNGDALAVDDDALSLDPQPAAFRFDGFGPIHGVAIVVGSNRAGETQEPALTVAEVSQRIAWLGNIYTEPTGQFIAW